VEIIKGNWGLEQITVRSTDVDTRKTSSFSVFIFSFPVGICIALRTRKREFFFRFVENDEIWCFREGCTVHEYSKTYDISFNLMQYVEGYVCPILFSFEEISLSLVFN